MKKILVGILTVMLLLLFTACGAKEKIEEKAGEAIAEKIIEEAGGNEVDIEGDTIKIKGEDGR